MRLGLGVACRVCRRFALASDGGMQTRRLGLLLLAALVVGIFL